VLPADDKRAAVEIDWKDGSTHLRVIQRSDTAIGVAYEDNNTVANLVALRPNKPVVSDGVDPAVAAIMRGGGGDGPPPPPPPADKKKPKK
jgi:subtilase family serine protease